MSGLCMMFSVLKSPIRPLCLLRSFKPQYVIRSSAKQGNDDYPALGRGLRDSVLTEEL